MAVSGSDLDNALKIWDTHSGEVIHHIPGIYLAKLSIFILQKVKVWTKYM